MVARTAQRTAQLTKGGLALLLYLAVFFAMLSGVAHASASQQSTGEASQLLEFANEQQQQRYRQLINELRCPKCQNQNLADSNAPIAEDLRQRLYEMLQQGRSDQEILQAMQARYGTFVLYQPPLEQRTAVLWILPLAVLLLGVAVIIHLQRRSQRTTKANKESIPDATASSQDAALSSEIERLRRELDND